MDHAQACQMKSIIETIVPKILLHQQEAGEYSSKVPQVLDQFQSISYQIIDHLEHGDLSDESRNALLWHDLNGSSHALGFFQTLFQGEDSTASITRCLEVIHILQTLRPK